MPNVYERMVKHLKLESRVGPVDAQQLVSEELSRVRELAATLIRADSSDIAFSTSGTAAWDSVVSSISYKTRRILVAPHEWVANVRTIKRIAKLYNCQLEVLPVLDPDNPDLSTWQNRIDKDVCLIAIPYVSSISGHSYPVEAIGKLARPAHCKLVVDAAQALGQIPIDIAKLNCDGLVSTTRKWICGPRQTAIIWTAPDLADAESVGLPMQCASERYEFMMDYNVACRLGMGVALNNALSATVESIQTQILTRAKAMLAGAEESGLSIVGSTKNLTGIVTLRVPQDRASIIAENLKFSKHEVKWPSLSVEPLLKPTHSDHGFIRLSAHCHNSLSDIDSVFEIIRQGLR